MTKQVAPSVTEKAFSCPHCGAYASQTWYSTFAKQLDDTPNIPDEARVAAFKQDPEITKDILERLLGWSRKADRGETFFVERGGDIWSKLDIQNLNISVCYVCERQSVWVHRKLVFPLLQMGPAPNDDMPDDVRADFIEARTIVNQSPRGASALLRLCVQKLCKHVGEPGENINTDIASLVKKGLHPRLQQALDVVRVVGNNAVHPGELDIKDDAATANHLFGMVNAIVDQLISHPKTVDALYQGLPKTTLDAIAKRDTPKK